MSIQGQFLIGQSDQKKVTVLPKLRKYFSKNTKWVHSG